MSDSTERLGMTWESVKKWADGKGLRAEKIETDETTSVDDLYETALPDFYRNGGILYFAMRGEFNTEVVAKLIRIIGSSELHIPKTDEVLERRDDFRLFFGSED